MDTRADKPVIRNVRVGQGETIKLNDGPSPQEISCDDIAKLALAMHDHTYFFSLRRGLSIRFSRDLNGSGTQGLYITRESDEAASKLIVVIFEPRSKNDDNFLYEADLLMDGRKDYDPTINRGKCGFVACMAETRIDWNSDETVQWRSDIDRLSRSPNTLTGWIEADLEMLVRCGTRYCYQNAILTRSDLTRHVAAGLSLEDLKTRLKCTKCGTRGARVMAF
ncbi:MAG: hypothetical protein KA085_19180 [Phenylobacterium sp.]|uniref:hypothetical protein n=1 Tax=Phenylobacterium sp. TaxID=1871053 RepID=UPI001B3DA5E9|nr:hypothetical protein [Phenylobacterium sp.]MBP7818248.1 hypothetical protein [Phenylobacterium sp.]